MMSTQIVEANKFSNNAFQKVQDIVTAEEMLSISVNGNPYTITMRTPGFEEELVRGILLSESVYSNKIVHPRCLITEKNDLNYATKVNVIIAPELLEQGIETKRNLMSVSSCGMCGKEELSLDLGSKKIEFHEKLHPQKVFDMFKQMSAQQEQFKYSGGSHAASAFAIDATMLCIMEDIGRHNAVDKVIGSLLLKGELSNAACLLVSGRISYEIVSKCYKAGIPYLAAVSAPSSLAIDFCNQLGITLLAFCREEKFTVYTHSERMLTL